MEITGTTRVTDAPKNETDGKEADLTIFLLVAAIGCILICCFAIGLAFVFYKQRDRRHKKSNVESKSESESKSKSIEYKNKKKMNINLKMLSLQSTSASTRTNKTTKIAMADLGDGTTAHIEHASSVDITEHNSENENDNEHSSGSDDLYQARPNSQDDVLTPQTVRSPVSSRKTPKTTRGAVSKGENGNNDANINNNNNNDNNKRTVGGTAASTRGKIGSARLVGSGGEQDGDNGNDKDDLQNQNGDDSSSEDLYGGSPKGNDITTDGLTEGGGIDEIYTQRSGNSDENVLLDLPVETGRHGTEGRASVDQGTIGNTDQ